MLEYIIKGFEQYNLFVNKEIHYVYKYKSTYKEIIFKAEKENFMHLCGINYVDPKRKINVSGKHFYNLLKSRKISVDFLIEKEDGTTDLKLKVLENLKDILTSNIRIIDERITFANLSFDHALRSRRKIFAITLIEEQFNSNIYLPTSLINLKTDKHEYMRNSCEVHCIYSQNRIGEKDFYYMSEQYDTFINKKEKNV